MNIRQKYNEWKKRKKALEFLYEKNIYSDYINKKILHANVLGSFENIPKEVFYLQDIKKIVVNDRDSVEKYKQTFPGAEIKFVSGEVKNTLSVLMGRKKILKYVNANNKQSQRKTL